MSFGLIYGIVILFSLPLLFLNKKVEHKLYTILITFLIAIIAYRSQPLSLYYSDSIRFDNLLNSARALPFFNTRLHWFLNWSEYSNQPVVAIYLWIISAFKQNGFLRFFTILIFLGIINKLLDTLIEKFNYSIRVKGITFIIFLGLFNIYYEIAGIRNYLSFSLLALGAIYMFFESSKKAKFISVFLIILSISFHTSALLPASVLIVSIFLKNKFMTIFKIALLFIQLLLPTIFDFLSKFSMIPFVQEIINKSRNYLYGGDTFDTYASTKQILVTTLLLIFCIFTNLVFSSIKDKKNMKRYNNFVQAIIFLCIGSVLSTQIYLRLIQLILFLTLPLICFLINKLIKKERLKSQENLLLIFWKLVALVMPFVMYILWFYVQYAKIIV